LFGVFFWVSKSVLSLVTGVKPGKQSNKLSVKRKDGEIAFVAVVSLLTSFVGEVGRQGGCQSAARFMRIPRGDNFILTMGKVIDWIVFVTTIGKVTSPCPAFTRQVSIVSCGGSGAKRKSREALQNHWSLFFGLD
jgi:hypothetical protein